MLYSVLEVGPCCGPRKCARRARMRSWVGASVRAIHRTIPKPFPPYVVNAQLEDHSSEQMNGAASYRGTASNSFLWTTGRCRLSYVFVVVSYPAVYVLPSAQNKRCRMSEPPAGIDAHVQASDELAVTSLRLVRHCSMDMFSGCNTCVRLVVSNPVICHH